MAPSGKSNLTLSKNSKIIIVTLSQCHQNNISSWSTLRRLHPTKFLHGTLCGGSILTIFHLRQLCGVVFLKHFIWGNSSELYSHTFILGSSAELYPHITFSLRQFYIIVFSKYLLWGNSTELYSQNISFKTTLQSRIIQKSLWGNSAGLYSQNIHFKTTFRSCIPTFF